VIRVNDKVMIPQEEHPDINFVGLLIGPRGNTLKTLEREVSEYRITMSHLIRFVKTLNQRKLELYITISG